MVQSKAPQTNNITKAFGGVRAVDGVSVSIKPGKVTGLIGPNGSGKTTFINLLTGMLPFDEGAVRVSGTELARIKPFDVPAYGMTRTFQQVRLFEQMSALDNVLVVLTEREVLSSLFERHGEYHTKKAKKILERMGLKEKYHENAENLSYGQRKLLEIARAVAMGAEIYFFDEPFAGLFPEMRRIVSSVINELRSAGKVVVLVEHDMDIIRGVSDHVIVLDGGALLAEGTPEEVLSNKKVAEAYLGD